MRRFLPSSLGGQLAALVLAGVLVAHVAAFALLLAERAQALRTAYRGDVVERIAGLVRVLDALPQALRPTLLDAVGTPRLRLTLEEESAVDLAGMDAAEATLADDLRRELLPAERPVGIDILRPRRTDADREAARERTHGEAGRDGARRWRRPGFVLSVRLGDGRWLVGSAAFDPPAIGWAGPWLVSLVLTAATILAVVTLLARRLTRPLNALADAAERVGRGEAVEPLPERGPSEIRATIAAFNAMGERLARFVRDRTRMLAAISHDLRTPITSLRLRAELVDDEALKEGMTATLDEMGDMVAGTLAFAREDESEETRTIDLAALLDGLADDWAGMGEDVSYEGPEHLPYRCRATALKRAFGNLVENAVRYGGGARVRLWRSKAGVEIAVEDDGPGIPAERIADVFDPFVRLETSRSRETGGVGLGLSIARSVVARHGGEVVLENRAEGGLRARVLLPEGGAGDGPRTAVGGSVSV